MAIYSTPVEKLDIGKMIQKTLKIIRKNIFIFSILATICSILPLAARLSLRPFVDLDKDKWAMISILWTLNLIVHVTFQSCAVQLISHDQNGRYPKFFEVLRNTINHLPSLIMGGLITWFAIVMGSIILLIPGLLAACSFAVLTPAQSSEKLSFMAALNRSRILTNGNRLNIFGLGLIYIVFVGGASAILLRVFGGFADGIDSIINYGIVLQLMLNCIASSLSAAGAAVLYFELRRIKDGVGATDLATVFD